MTLLPGKWSFLVKALGLGLLLTAQVHAAPPSFHGTQGPVPEALAARMRQHSWRQECPTPIVDLTYLRLSYFGYDRAIHEGELVVHKELAGEVLAIFKALFDQRFPVEKMKVIDDYQGDDDASMADNNTSAFNCRFVAGKPGVFSKHSHGRAIDINPRTNPMVVDGTVFPPGGFAFVDRKKKAPGILRAGDWAVRVFTRRGWIWGGGWVSMKDYQHFEK
jgi:D-alanyl-D-alanine carboxypeptidase